MKLRYPFVLLLTLLLSACAVYKIDVQQGNEITVEMLNKLEIGMSKREVSKVLGNPLVNDPFHVDRWDYYFYLKEGTSGDVQQASATLHFTEDALSKVVSTLRE